MYKINTAEHFCWLYAVGCLEIRLQAATLTKTEFDHAMSFVNDSVLPPKEFVPKWFPKPFERVLQKYGEVTPETMKLYWREDHLDMSEPSPVYHARIKNVEALSSKNPLFIYAYSEKKLPGGGRMLVASNYHKYHLRYNDEVRIHGNVVAEPFPKTP